MLDDPDLRWPNARLAYAAMFAGGRLLPALWVHAARRLERGSRRSRSGNLLPRDRWLLPVRLRGRGRPRLLAWLRCGLLRRRSCSDGRGSGRRASPPISSGADPAGLRTTTARGICRRGRMARRATGAWCAATCRAGAALAPSSPRCPRGLRSRWAAGAVRTARAIRAIRAVRAVRVVRVVRASRRMAAACDTRTPWFSRVAREESTLRDDQTV